MFYTEGNLVTNQNPELSSCGKCEDRANDADCLQESGSAVQNGLAGVVSDQENNGLNLAASSLMESPVVSAVLGSHGILHQAPTLPDGSLDDSVLQVRLRYSKRRVW